MQRSNINMSLEQLSLSKKLTLDEIRKFVLANPAFKFNLYEETFTLDQLKVDQLPLFARVELVNTQTKTPYRHATIIGYSQDSDPSNMQLCALYDNEKTIRMLKVTGEVNYNLLSQMGLQLLVPEDDYIHPAFYQAFDIIFQTQNKPMDRKNMPDQFDLLSGGDLSVFLFPSPASHLRNIHDKTEFDEYRTSLTEVAPLAIIELHAAEAHFFKADKSNYFTYKSADKIFNGIDGVESAPLILQDFIRLRRLQILILNSQMSKEAINRKIEETAKTFILDIARYHDFTDQKEFLASLRNQAANLFVLDQFNAYVEKNTQLNLDNVTSTQQLKQFSRHLKIEGISTISLLRTAAFAFTKISEFPTRSNDPHGFQFLDRIKTPSGIFATVISVSDNKLNVLYDDREFVQSLDMNKGIIKLTADNGFIHPALREALKEQVSLQAKIEAAKPESEISFYKIANSITTFGKSLVSNANDSPVKDKQFRK